MDFEYWWLIGLPVFFTLGWIAARLDLGHLVRESRELPKSYFRGLNFLLNEQPDKAIEAFIEVARIDRETLELHFALGSLFRRRGETERAIRMHRNLLDRGDLGDDERLQALFELGQDYLKAGLLDRAEDAFLRLVDTPHGLAARRYLLEIYQQEKDWPRAIELARSIANDAPDEFPSQIAHLGCELALVQYARDDADAALGQLQLVLRENPSSVRANILIGDIHAAKGRHDEAIDAWKRLEAQDPQYLALIGQRLVDSHNAMGRPADALLLIGNYLNAHPGLDLLDVAADAALSMNVPERAHQILKEQLRKYPTLRGLDKLLEVQLNVTSMDRRPDLELIRGLIHGHVERLSRYRCDNCGFKAKQHYWHCPACGKWDTYAPRRHEEPDSAR